METNKLIAGIVAAAISIIMLAAVLMPVLSDATTTHTTFTNKGYFDMTYTETDSIVMDWYYTDPTNIVVNDTIISLSEATQQTTILCGDLWLLRYDPAGGGGIAYYASAGSATGASVAGSTDLHVEAASGSVTVTPSAGAVRTNTYTYLFCIADDGEYVMKEKDSIAYVHEDSRIYGMGLTTILSQSVYLKFDGTIDDPNAEVFRYSADPVTVSNTVVNAVANDSYNDLYELSSLTITVTDGTNTGDLIYSYFIVPAEVTAEKAVHLTDGMNAVLNVIPILIIIAVLLGVVAVLILRRE